MTVFFDTSVLIHAQGPGARGDAARRLLMDGGIISVQVLNEFANVLRRKFRLEWNIVAAAVADARELFDPIRPLDIETHEAAMELASAHGFSFYDSLIVASALQARCETLFTEDLHDGRRIDSLVIVSPFAPEG